MFGHEFPSSDPLCDIEVSVSKPGVSITTSTAPEGLGHVIIKMHIDSLPSKFLRRGIKDLQSCSPLVELWIVLQHFLENNASIRCTKRIGQGILQRHVSATIQDIVNHLDSEGQTHDIEIEATDLGDDVFD